MEENISLFDLLNLAIGTPQRGAVNFSALHALLLSLLRQMDIRDMKTRWRDTPPGTLVVVGAPAPELDPRTEEEQREVEPGAEPQSAASSSPSSSSPTPASSSGPAADDQWRLRSRIQSCEDGVSKAMKLIEQLQSQKNHLREEMKEDMKEEVKEEVKEEMKERMKEEVKEEMKERMKEEVKEEMKERIREETMEELLPQQKTAGARAGTASVVEKCCHRVDALEDTVRSLRDALQKYPDPEELSQCVTWDAMQSTLLSERENLQKELVNSGVVDRATYTPFLSAFTAVNTAPPHTSTPSSSLHPGEDTVRPTAPGSPSIPGQMSTDTRTATDGPPAVTGAPQHPKTDQTAAGTPLTREASGSARYSETMEALRNIGKLKERFGRMEARVVALEDGKVDQSQLRQLKELVTNKGSAPNNLLDQLNQQRALIDGLMRDREKLDNLEDMFMNMSSQENTETSSEAASGSLESDGRAAQELRQQMSYIRKSVQKLEEDMKQLKAKQALTLDRRADQQLQDQLDDLRGMLEDMMQSLTSELCEAGQDESRDSQGPAQSKDRSAFTSRTVNAGRKLSLLFQHYEQLQDTVNSLLQQQNGGRAGTLKDGESVELVNDVQKAILQLQAECEKLHETSRCLNEDNRQKQSHIEELYKTTEELGEKKADKLLVESEMKVDKSALVSRLQFDSATEQLNAMFHELLNKVTGQEQDWHKVIDKLSTEMECKLNRMELDSVKRQLEDRWKNIHEKLQAQGAPEHEDAAGIRKQLVDRFHCLSCDRPVVMHTPGQPLVKLASTPGFPSHKSIRPFTVYALEQFRQHYRSLKPGTNRLNFEAANSGRMREELQKSHAVMCRQIESAQRRLKHGDTAGDNVVRNQPAVHSERISEMTDYGHLAVSRSCGGSHTVTSASQRRTGLQYMKHHAQTEVDAVTQSEEVDIVGLDGHIYKGRLNAPPIRTTETRLPTISTKDGVCKTKEKAKCSLRPAASPEVGHGAPVHHPHSAKSAQCSRSASSSSGRDWPVSALGCASQSSVPAASAEAESNADEPLDL